MQKFLKISHYFPTSSLPTLHLNSTPRTTKCKISGPSFTQCEIFLNNYNFIGQSHLPHGALSLSAAGSLDPPPAFSVVPGSPPPSSLSLPLLAFPHSFSPSRAGHTFRPHSVLRACYQYRFSFPPSLFLFTNRRWQFQHVGHSFF